MDVKELNKSQLILLTILISFITSIATGIFTVALLQQAPSSVTTPINRIVQQTVEKIVPNSILKTETVVVKEEDLVVDAISKNETAIFTISKDGFDVDGKPTDVVLGKGVVVSKDGTIATDALLVPDKGTFYAKNNSGKFKIEFISANKDGFSLVKLGDAVDGKSKAVFSTPIFGDISKMKIGQKIIVVGNSVSSFMYDGNKDLKINNNKTNAGGLVLDLNGNVLGIVLSGDTDSFVSIVAINNALNPVKETPKI